MLNIYGADRILTGVLENAFDVTVNQKINAINYLNFSLPFNDKKNDLCVFNNLIKYDGDYYRIISVGEEYGESGAAVYKCEHVFGLLMNEVILNKLPLSERPIDAALTAIFSNQTENAAWTLGRCDFTETVIVDVVNVTVLKAIQSVTEYLEADYLYTFDCSVYPYVFNLISVNTDIPPKHTITGGNNLVSLSKQEDYTYLCTRLYPLGNKINIADINGGLPYIQSPSEYTDKYGVISQVWSDLRFTNKQNLLSAARVILKNRQELNERYEVSYTDFNSADVKLGDVTEIKDSGGKRYIKAYITEIDIKEQENELSVIYISKQEKNLDAILAKRADRQKDLEQALQDIDAGDIIDNSTIENIVNNIIDDRLDELEPVENTYNGPFVVLSEAGAQVRTFGYSLGDLFTSPISYVIADGEPLLTYVFGEPRGEYYIQGVPAILGWRGLTEADFALWTHYVQSFTVTSELGVVNAHVEIESYNYGGYPSLRPRLWVNGVMVWERLTYQGLLNAKSPVKCGIVISSGFKTKMDSQGICGGVTPGLYITVVMAGYYQYRGNFNPPDSAPVEFAVLDTTWGPFEWTLPGGARTACPLEMTKSEALYALNATAIRTSTVVVQASVS